MHSAYYAQHTTCCILHTAYYAQHNMLHTTYYILHTACSKAHTACSIARAACSILQHAQVTTHTSADAPPQQAPEAEEVVQSSTHCRAVATASRCDSTALRSPRRPPSSIKHAKHAHTTNTPIHQHENQPAHSSIQHKRSHKRHHGYELQRQRQLLGDAPASWQGHLLLPTLMGRCSSSCCCCCRQCRSYSTSAQRIRV